MKQRVWSYIKKKAKAKKKKKKLKKFRNVLRPELTWKCLHGETL